MYTIAFYSFKGGVGRTLALVNAAHELANRGKKVLIVDFDLEAPGIQTFSSLKQSKPTLGIVDYIAEYVSSGEAPHIKDYVYKPSVTIGGNGELWVMPAGNQAGEYGQKLNSINWQELYDKHDGYLMFEDMKEQWKRELAPDYVLIDSRTGHTDVGGICTRQLPNAVSIFFLPNQQNLAGLTKVVKDIRGESSTREGKSIQLHFVMSNVPDIDDEERILEHWTEEFEDQLGYKVPAHVIHHYSSLSLLNQVVFTLARPKSKLAIEYIAFVDGIVRHNPEDRDGVIDFLRDVNRRAERAATHLGISAMDLEERLSKIRSIHAGDGEILYRLTTIRQRQGRIQEALALINESIDSGYRNSGAFLRRAELDHITDDSRAARRDITEALNSEDLNYFEANRALRKLWDLDPSTLNGVADSPAISALDPDDTLQLAIDLSWSREALEVAEILLTKLLNREIAENRSMGDEPYRFALGFCLIGLGKYREAMNTMVSPRTSLENHGVPLIFNYAMAEWAESGKVPFDLFQHLSKLKEKKSIRSDANYTQCLSIVFWACNKKQVALEYLQKAREGIRARPEPTISCLSYLKVSPGVFHADLNTLEQLMNKEELVCPLTIAETESQPNLFPSTRSKLSSQKGVAVMSSKKDIHVVPHKDNWATRKENSERISSTHRTQSAAIDQAVSQAKKDGVEVVIHRRDGKIRDSDSYGKDPNPPKDRKH